MMEKTGIVTDTDGQIADKTKEELMDLKKITADRLRQYQLLIAFAAQQKKKENQ